MRKSLITYCLLLFCVWIQAQSIRVPWNCGFEEDEDVEISNWVLNPGTATAMDQWTIGKATRSERKRSMYISTDGGLTASHGNKRNIVMAYRLINLPVHDKGYKEYEVSFDYRQPSANGTLYVFFDYASTLITGTDNLLQYVSTNRADGIPKKIMDNARYVSSEMPPMTESARTKEMKDTPGWRKVSITQGVKDDYTDRFSSTTVKRQLALVFVWINKNPLADGTAGACIDNVQIAKAHIKKPSDLKASFQCADSSVTITWKGGLDGYIIGWRKSTAGTWRMFTYTGPVTQTNHSYTVTGLKDGVYDFRVCGYKTNVDESAATGTTVIDTTGYVVLNNYLLYCPENQCINFADLDHAECTYGPNEDLYKYDNKIDFGWEDVWSIHTVNTDQDAYDIRAYDPVTKEQLKIIPENAMVSVRLGNWYSPSDNKDNPGNAAVNDTTAKSKQINGETISYEFVVDSATSAILLLRYAMVFEESNHDRADQPYFKLSVFDENGDIVGGLCGEQYFYCPNAQGEDEELAQQRIINEHWHVYYKEDQPEKNNDLGFKNSNIWWKNWSTMGLNLSEYDGQLLRVVIESRGCGQSIHYGYGYFTLGCASAAIEAEQCGNTPTATADAPEGFEYQWYALEDSALYWQGALKDPKDGHTIVVSRSADLTVTAGDSRVYVCHLSYMDSPDCYFELRTRLLPRNPLAMHTYSIDAELCRSLLTLRDSSRITVPGDGGMVVTADMCDYSQWSLRSLKTDKRASFSGTQFTYEADRQGDAIEVMHTAYISNGECDNTSVDTIYTPDITTPDSLIFDTICDNHKYSFAGKQYNKSGVYYDSLVNRFGCDSVEVLYLHVNPTNMLNRNDTICTTNLPYVFEGTYKGQPKRYEFSNYQSYITSDNYVIKLDNSYNCDSTINLELTIIPLLEAEVDSIPMLCSDGGGFSLNYQVLNGDYDSLKIYFSDGAHVAGLRDTTFYHDPYTHPVIPPTDNQVDYLYDEKVLPDKYYMYVRFYQHPCCNYNRVDTIPIDIRYANSIIVQKWNDVLALLDEKHNVNRCSFAAYQWYKNNEPIMGATKPYLYTGEELDFDADYSVLLTRAKDSVQQFTCTYRPIHRDIDPENSYPTLISAGSKIRSRLDSEATVTFYTLTGAVYSRVDLPAGECWFTAPNNVGYYILSVISADGRTTKQKILITP